MKKIYLVLKYEFRRFFKTTRGYILLLTGTVPLILFLSISAEKARIEYLTIGNIEPIQKSLLIGYVFYSYILTIFFTIMLYSDILSNEKSYEFLLVSTTRLNILLGKILLSFILVTLLLTETLISFLLTMISYSIPFPSIDLLVEAFMLTLLICVLLVIPVILFSNTVVIKLGNVSSSMANYLAIFIFFVIPFIVYFSLFQLSLFQSQMLDFSIHTLVYSLSYAVFLPQQSIQTNSLVNEFSVLVGLGVIGYLSSMILFVKSSIIS